MEDRMDGRCDNRKRLARTCSIQGRWLVMSRWHGRLPPVAMGRSRLMSRDHDARVAWEYNEWVSHPDRPAGPTIIRRGVGRDRVAGCVPNDPAAGMTHSGEASRHEPTSRPHESRARREAVGRPRTGVVPRRQLAPRGIFRGAGLPGDLGAGPPRHPERAAGLRPGVETLVARHIAYRPRTLRAQAPGREGVRQATGGRPSPVPPRRRVDLRHRRRPRGRADLPLYPGTDRLRGQARPEALAQFADPW